MTNSRNTSNAPLAWFIAVLAVLALVVLVQNFGYFDSHILAPAFGFLTGAVDVFWDSTFGLFI